ncbi:hypothetical protein QE152_g2043 [Popillia japonica]|uniref:CCHC-type domain-containing protein n=1 Tax=Popillia japonica TaxID=7064 RepID=A0AAW1N0Q2_POPJA
MKWSSQDKESDHKTKSVLYLLKNNDSLDDIMECKTAKDIWKTLKEIYTKYDEWHGLLLLQDFVTTKKKNDESINEYLRKSSGFIVLGLPNEYKYLSRNLRVGNDDLTLSRDKGICSEESEFFKRKPQRGSDEKKPNRESQSHENLRCYRCLEFGHIGRHCKENNNEADGQTKIAFRAMMRVDSEAYLTNDPYFKTDKNSWILDSGSTDHMCCHLSKFKDFKEKETIIEVAGGERLLSTEFGNIDFTLSTYEITMYCMYLI